MSAQRFGELVVRFRWLLLPLTLVLAMAAASGGKYLGFTSDYRVFFSDDNPQLAAFEELQNTYTKNDNVMFIVAPKDGKVFTPKNLSVIQELTEESWQIPYSIRVDSITNFQHTSANGDDLVVEDLIQNPGLMTDAELEQAKAIAMSEPSLFNRLIPERAHVTGVNVTIELPGTHKDTEVPEVVAFVRQMAKDYAAKYPDIDFYLSGIVMMNNSFPEAAQGDMKELVPMMYGMIILVMILMLRSVSGTLGTVLIMAMSVMTAMGLTGYAGIKLTGPSASAPTIILTLAVADAIHFLVTMFYNMRHGMAKHDAIVESLRVNLMPIFLTSLTTVIGFLTMNFSEVPPFQHLGNMTAVGVTAAFLFSVLTLPAFMAIVPVRVKPRKEETTLFMDRFADFVIKKQKALFWGMLVVIVGLTASITRLEVNDLFVHYFDDRYEFRVHTDFMTENLTGIYQIGYSLESGEEGGIAEPAFLNKVDEFADWFRQQPGVIHVNTLTDVMKRLNKNMHGDDPAWQKIPDSRELAAQYLLLYELSLPYGLDLNNQINVSKSATRFTVTLDSLSTKKTMQLEERANSWLKANAPTPMQVAGASPTIMFTHIAERNIRSMLTGTTLALVLISLILIVAVRSLKIGLISLVPNLAPAAMAFGLWGIINGQVGLATSVVTSISLGIVVDDTVHFLTKYLRARREHGYDATEAVRYAFRTVGTALWVTSFILVAGFLVLSRSGFELNSEMGLLTAIAIVFAIIADFLFLPPLLMLIDRIQDNKKNKRMTRASAD